MTVRTLLVLSDYTRPGIEVRACVRRMTGGEYVVVIGSAAQGNDGGRFPWYEPATYFTDDPQDARETAMRMLATYDPKV